MRLKKTLFIIVVCILTLPFAAIILFLFIGWLYSRLTYTSIHHSDLKALNLYFRTERCDSTTKIYFGNNEKMEDYIEVYPSTDIAGPSMYFVIDNTTDSSNIEYVIFEENKYHDFHVRNVDFYIGHFSISKCQKGFASMSDIQRTLTEITDYSNMPRTHILVNATLAQYNRGINFELYELEDSSKTALIVDYLDAPDFISFSKMAKSNVAMDLNSLRCAYGEPAEHNRYILNEQSKKKLISSGWLFMDTLNFKGSKITIDQITWKNPKGMTTVIYRQENDSLLIPINGATYTNYIKQTDGVYFF